VASLPHRSLLDQEVRRNFKALDRAINAERRAIGSFSAYRAGALSVATGAIITFDTEDWDVSGWHDVTTNLGRYTPLIAGYYRFDSHVAYSSTLAANKYWDVALFKNGSLYREFGRQNAANTASYAPASGSNVAVANGTTDYFEVGITHNIGGSKAISVGAPYAYFQGELIGTK
jgi:hypothetical protein